MLAVLGVVMCCALGASAKEISISEGMCRAQPEERYLTKNRQDNDQYDWIIANVSHIPTNARLLGPAKKLDDDCTLQLSMFKHHNSSLSIDLKIEHDGPLLVEYCVSMIRSDMKFMSEKNDSFVSNHGKYYHSNIVALSLFDVKNLMYDLVILRFKVSLWGLDIKPILASLQDLDFEGMKPQRYTTLDYSYDVDYMESN